MKLPLWAVVSVTMLLVGCGTTAQELPSSLPDSSQSYTFSVENSASSESVPALDQENLNLPPASVSEIPASSLSFPDAIPLGSKYVEQIADELLGQIIDNSMNDVERLRAVYDYLIANTYFADPVGLDVWQWRGNEQQPPNYLETRAISPILFGIGTCEDYAAAMAVLAMRMGYPCLLYTSRCV